MPRTGKRELFIGAVLSLASLSLPAAARAQSLEQRLEELEMRVSALEERLAVAEEETVQAQQRAEAAEATAAAAAATAADKDSGINLANLNPFVRYAWVNEAWTRPEPWQSVTEGLTPEQVVKILGEPTRTVRSLKPKVDLVYFYEGNIQGHKIRGRVSFRKGTAVAVYKPTFE